MKQTLFHRQCDYTGPLILCLFLTLMMIQSCKIDMPDEVETAYQKLDKNISFNFHVKPILSDKCFACHGPDIANNKGDLRLDISEIATKVNNTTGNRAIVPSRPAKSALVDRILSHD